MIENLAVRNFKSLKDFDIKCKKINIFIGKPNAGKSNILESLGIFSTSFGKLEDFVRLENMTNLFYDLDVSEKISITADNLHCEIKFENGRFIGTMNGKQPNDFRFHFDYDYKANGNSGHGGISPIKFYKFGVLDYFLKHESNFLLPPKGENLLAILLTNKELKKVLSNIMNDFNLKIVFKPLEFKIEVQKEIEDIIISYPYSIISDTLQRIIFYLAAIETNKMSVIIFEEPGVHTFPFYTKFLAERISRDETNQYFISTHNPYFLLSILEKTSVNKIGIFVTYIEKHQTKVKLLTEKELEEVLDLDASIFLNLDKFLA